MKKLFYSGLAGLAIFEILNVYFIMPMPGSQRMDSLGVAYFLYRYRWMFRVAFCLLIVAGAASAFKTRRKWAPLAALAVVGGIAWFFNFEMAADHMFLQPQNLVLKSRNDTPLHDSTVVIGIENAGQAKAYPMRYLTYHHQVQDTVGGKSLLITYCSVCRTGRVYEPAVGGRPEKFRLVGMDHFNAMLEDATTKSWWRQATGEAVTGQLKGTRLPEFECQQMTLGQWASLWPNTLVMQQDDASLMEYDSLARYERGKSVGELTRTDSLSWKEKSWVIGIENGTESKAFDWNRLLQERLVQDDLGSTPILLAIASDGMSFAAFERPAGSRFSLENNVLISDSLRYDLAGRSLLPGRPALKKIPAYQEFWHSWQTFHPATQQY